MNAPNLKTVRATAFKSWWIRYGMNLFNRAEAHGVDFLKFRPEQFSGAVIQAEEFATPDEYKTRGKFEDLFPITQRR